MKNYQCPACNYVFALDDNDLSSVTCVRCRRLIELNPKNEQICSNEESPVENLQFETGFYCHKKTGNVYLVTGKVTNCTNSNDQQLMVSYQREGNHFVREEKEFLEKFVKLNYEKQPAGTPISRIFDKSML